jgi:hypothetical protein
VSHASNPSSPQRGDPILKDKSNLGTKKKQEVLRRTCRLLSLMRHGPHWKRRVQQFFYCCVCIRYRGNVSAESLPSNVRGKQTYTQTATWTHKPTLFFNKEIRLKIGHGSQRGPKPRMTVLAKASSKSSARSESQVRDARRNSCSPLLFSDFNQNWNNSTHFSAPHQHQI